MANTAPSTAYIQNGSRRQSLESYVREMMDTAKVTPTPKAYALSADLARLGYKPTLLKPNMFHLKGETNEVLVRIDDKGQIHVKTGTSHEDRVVGPLTIPALVDTLSIYGIPAAPEYSARRQNIRT